MKHRAEDPTIPAVVPEFDLAGRHIVVMGLGRFGGGVGAARFAFRCGAKVLVTDVSKAETLQSSIDALGDLPVNYRLGGHCEEDFRQADMVIVNPAVDPRGNRYLEAARSTGGQITSEIRLLAALIPPGAITIGVTGSAGKSTVTAMIGHLLRRLHGEEHVHVGGNLGGSLLDTAQTFTSKDLIVLELSSFMLEGLDLDAWSPRVAVVTNLAPNHLDRHGSFENYVAAKQAITNHQCDGDIAVLGPEASSWTVPGRRIVVDNPQVNVPLLLPGQHNQHNAAMALATAEATIGAVPLLLHGLDDFTGLPHRLQFVCEHESVRYFNDSKASTPESAILGMGSFERGQVHVILGGYDKGADLAAMSRFAASHCRAIYTIGQTGHAIAKAAAGHGPATVVPCRTLRRAIQCLHKTVAPKNVVLLSPGCASWDQFENFQQRGTDFVEAVLQCTGKTLPPMV